ncbi:pentapeptide repeat-containing protein [Nodularia spumigena CS-587/03]|nr:pentapeptide repeat-containing protein [Nodularia spumigena CS-587/03]
MLIAIINTSKILRQLQGQLTSNQASLKKIILGIGFAQEKALDITFNPREKHLFTLIKNLNDKNIENRLAVIYDLEEFSQNYQQYHWEIMVILTNFVQNQAADMNGDELNNNPSPGIPTDIQAALTVIGRRDTNKDELDEPLDLSHTDMKGANLHQANLELTNLYQVNLSGANLSGANLSGAILSAANLCGANLAGANLQSANLYLANLEKATLGDAILTGANLREAKFE